MTVVYKNLNGNEGPTGATGATGPGVPVGGSAGNYLKKSSGTNYDTAWASLETDVEAIMADSAQNIKTTGSVTANKGTDKEIDLAEHLIDLVETSLEQGGVITINANTAKYDISAGTGILVDHNADTFKQVTWSAFSAQTPALTGIRYVYIEDANNDGIGNIFETATAPTPQSRRQKIFLGRVVVATGGTISAVVNYPVIDEGIAAQVYEIASGIGIVNNGILASANGANLSVNLSSGTLMIPGANYANDNENPHFVSFSGSSPATFQHITQTAATGSNVTVVTPTNYDNAGVITAISGSNNQATNMRVYVFPSGNVRIAYGQTIYSNLANAVAALPTESFTVNPSIPGNGQLIGLISVTKGATSLSDTTAAHFQAASKLGETFGTSSATVPSTQQDPSLGFSITENWLSNTAAGNNGWTLTANSGTVGMNASTGSGVIMGIARCDTAASSTSAPTLSLGGGSSIVFGGATIELACYVQLQALSTVTEEYITRFGFHSSISSAAPAHGAFFEYDRLNSVNWRIRTYAATSPTTTTTSTAVAAGAWTKFSITINSAASLVTFYINGVSVGTINATIPSGTSQAVSPVFQMIKSAGSTARNLYIDWCTIKAVY